MLMRQPLRVYLAFLALAAAGLLSIILPAVGSARVTSGSCAPTPQPGAVRLIVARGSVTVGESVHFRVDNTKGPPITYGADYSIQECVAGVWRLAPFSPAAATRQRIRQRRGRGRWWDAPIPGDAQAGEYRIRKRVEVETRGRWLYRDFAIVPPASAPRLGAQ